VNAAAALAQGMAQVNAIKSTNIGGGGGSSGGGGAAPAPAEQAAPTSNLFVTGVTAGHFYSGEMMRDLFTAINEHLRNGGRLQFG
jgi:hypothetical protein